jgi:hypothetical protein
VDVDSFVRDGFVAVRQAVDASTAAACRELVWQSMARRGLRRSDPATWPPLVRIDDLDAGPFTAAGLSPALTAAYDELIGPGRWRSPVDVGRALMVRFPSEDRAGAGYHIEASYPGPGGQGGRANVRSRARGLLALFLLTDVGPGDAPTRLVCGSHLTVARFLAPYGEAGTDADAGLWYPSTLPRGAPAVSSVPAAPLSLDTARGRTANRTDATSSRPGPGRRHIDPVQDKPRNRTARDSRAGSDTRGPGRRTPGSSP